MCLNQLTFPFLYFPLFSLKNGCVDYYFNPRYLFYYRVKQLFTGITKYTANK